ncbi:MAG: DUF4388 domain-containing protein [Deltaproteobacteria bacterium]|nr:DUF4388 domain-containing protein [Deltaproteobacteria bacterium]
MQRLRHAFDTPAALAAEFERNISKGGAQLVASEDLEPRSFVDVEFAFKWRPDTLVLAAEVIFSGGGQVAVQFQKSAPDLRTEFAPFLGERASPNKLDSGSREPDDAALPPSPDPRAKTVLRVQSTEQAGSQALHRDPLASVADRRRSGRAVARVPARMQTGGVSLDGRTRDLSETGVLISGDASDLPLGESVDIELQHPKSGERIAVRGRVSRHVETDGTVAAVGVEFEMPEERAGELRDVVSDVTRAEAERTKSGISGRIEELGAASLLQMLGQSSPQGTLTATHGAEEATVAFENGAIRYALLGRLRGTKALARMLKWETGTFSFYKHVDAISDEPAPIQLQHALLEAARQVDEAARSKPLDMKARYRVDASELASAGALTKLEEAIVDLAGAALTVRRMIDIIPDADARVVESIRGLVDRGVLVPK